MNSEANFASLSPSLLARKGGAKPAMRPQHANMAAVASASPEKLEDLGWNDMGEEDEPSNGAVPLTPAPANPDTAREAREQDEEAKDTLTGNERPAVHQQREEAAQRLQQTVTATKPVKSEKLADFQTSGLVARKTVTARKTLQSAVLEKGKRAAFTLRLDAERHLKLRLACTVRKASAQQLVTQALDELLRDMPGIDALAAQVGDE